MSAAAAPAADAPAPAKGSKKKLIIIIVAALLVVLIGGGVAFMLLKKKPAEDEEDGGGDAHGKPKAAAKADAHEAAAPPTRKHDPKHPPAFVPLDPFTVNLADKDSERFAQIGVTLEIEDGKVADELKVYMPAIRNNILMVLSHKTAAQLLTREGLEAIDLKFFMHLHRCHLKNANLSGKRVFGYLTVENAIARNYCVQNDQGRPELVYASVDDLVNDGWVVD